jgi:spore coat-associated protein N
MNRLRILFIRRSSVPPAGTSSFASRALLTLAVVGVLAFTLYSVRPSDASFVAASSNASNVFVAGTLSHTNDRNDQVMLTASGLEPGLSSVGTMTLTGTGDVPGEYVLTASSIVNVPSTPALSDMLDLTVEDITGPATTLYDGDASAVDADLGTIAPGETHSYRITLEYPDGPNYSALQGATMGLVLQVKGVTQ